MLQMCLTDRAGVENFKKALQDIAVAQELRYIDSSGSTQRQLRVTGANGKNMHSSGGLIYVGVEGDDGLGLEGGNMGLNDYDVAIGFNGSDDAKTLAFADIVKTKLSEQWKFTVVPQNSGAFPSPECVSR
jgi:hypothetical protein